MRGVSLLIVIIVSIYCWEEDLVFPFQGLLIAEVLGWPLVASFEVTECPVLVLVHVHVHVEVSD